MIRAYITDIGTRQDKRLASKKLFNNLEDVRAYVTERLSYLFILGSEVKFYEVAELGKISNEGSFIQYIDPARHDDLINSEVKSKRSQLKKLLATL